MSHRTYFITSFAVLAGLLFRNAPGSHEWKHSAPKQIDGTNGWIRFTGGDGSTSLAGRLYLPPSEERETSPPVVILAHGLGLTQDCNLQPFVDAFTSAGFAALTFDYATFGASDGSPRHVVDPSGHVGDLRAAVATIRERSSEFRVDAERVALWGTSYGGGHSLVAAAGMEEDGAAPLRAVVALVPHLASGVESVIGTLVTSPSVTLQGLSQVTLGMLKWVMLYLGKHRLWYLPLHGLPGSAAMMQNPGDDKGYASLLPGKNEYGWRNAVTAGSVLRALVYQPLDSVKQIKKVPVLFVAAEQDTLCPVKYVQRAVELLGAKSELLTFSGAGHFDVYSGELLEQMLTSTVSFLQKNFK